MKARIKGERTGDVTRSMELVVEGVRPSHAYIPSALTITRAELEVVSVADEAKLQR
jgi:hypothetical protein